MTPLYVFSILFQMEVGTHGHEGIYEIVYIYFDSLNHPWRYRQPNFAKKGKHLYM